MGGCCSSGAGDQAVGGEMSQRQAAANDVADAVSLLAPRVLGSPMQVTIEAQNIKNKDTFSKSDPLAVLLLKESNGEWREIGRTEVVSNNVNPQWVRQIKLVYNFEALQNIAVRVYDIDSKYDGRSPQDIKLEDQDFLGEMLCLFSEVVTTKHQVLTRPLRNRSLANQARGTITIRAEQMANTNALITCCFRAEGLDAKDSFGKSDPYLKVSYLREDGGLSGVFKTEVLRNTLNPTWAPMKVTLQQLCNSDYDRPLVLECFDWDRAGDHDLIGEVQTSLKHIIALSQSRQPLQFINAKKKGTSAVYQNSGTLHIEGYTMTPRPSFLDYIFGGCEISFLVAVDFTASNGDPAYPNSLHYFDPEGRPNQLSQLLFYDTDKKFPVWGFGGQVGNNTVSHCFNLNGNPQNPEVAGVQGILDAYMQAIQHVSLSGPTLFTPVINASVSIASEGITQEKQKYFVLLIITDGEILDMEETVAAVIAASSLPLSILIVGVGDADFDMMETLDSDKRRLRLPDGRQAARDIVQFVRYNDIVQPNRGPASVALAQRLLAELPMQLLAFMESKHIMPNPQHQAPSQSAPRPY
eukprot:jgi/Chlat1/1641/Chrsp127S01948